MNGSTYRISSFSVYSFGMSQVNHRYFAFFIDHKIRSFDVSINEAIIMKIFENEANLSYNDFSEDWVEITNHLK